jgi:hypothetical protein
MDKPAAPPKRVAHSPAQSTLAALIAPKLLRRLQHCSRPSFMAP